MVKIEDIEQVINNILKGDPTETDKCGSGSSSGGSGGSGGKKKPKKSKSPKQLFEEFSYDDYSHETYDDEEYAHSDDIDLDWESPQGRMQKIQSDLQWDRTDNYTSVEKKTAYQWSTCLFIDLNRWLFKGEGESSDYAFTQYIGGEKDITLGEASSLLSKAIDKSPRMQENCVTYRYGPIGDLANMEVGDTGKFDGFQSTSFNYTVATTSLSSQVGGWFKNNRAMIRFFNPKGSKGMVIDESVTCHDWQSEWLLDKGQNYILVGKGNVDYDGEEIYTYDVLIY